VGDTIDLSFFGIPNPQSIYVNGVLMANKSVNRVAFILPKFGLGGAEQVVLQLSNELSLQKIEILCVCFEDLGIVGEKLIDSQFEIISIGSEKSYDLLSLFKLRDVLKKFNPDVISLHSYHVLPYTVVAKLFNLKCDIVFTAHGLLYSGFETKKWINRFFSLFISKLTSVSDDVALRHREYLSWKKPIYTIENGSKVIKIDPLSGLSIRKEFGIPNDSFVFLTIGNLKPEKGIEYLLDAAFLMTKNIHDNYVFLIVGAFQDKKYYEEIIQRRADLNLTEVVLFANYREDVSSFYSCADAFFLSSCSEGLPMVVLEAMSCKLPVVSTSVGGLPKVLSDGAGILVAPRSPDELALAMKSLLNNEDDCRNSLAMAGYEKMVKFYSLERMSRDYLNVFSGLEL